MKAKRFIVAERPRLVAITEHPKVPFAEYEQQLRSMQFTVQAIQQTYLGTRDRSGLQRLLYSYQLYRPVDDCIEASYNIAIGTARICRSP